MNGGAAFRNGAERLSRRLAPRGASPDNPPGLDGVGLRLHNGRRFDVLLAPGSQRPPNVAEVTRRVIMPALLELVTAASPPQEDQGP